MASVQRLDQVVTHLVEEDAALHWSFYSRPFRAVRKFLLRKNAKADAHIRQLLIGSRRTKESLERAFHILDSGG